MSYRYEDFRPKVFTDEGQRMFLAIRDRVHELTKTSGAFVLGKALAGSGDSWLMLACIDRLVELGEIVEVPTDRRTQDKIFIRVNR